ncbi:MAG: DUF2911 domain-containing protein [Acidobacteria bacterium]|nr:DUF2911 domain-containing protein [Acidobacteriota bacterium]
MPRAHVLAVVLIVACATAAIRAQERNSRGQVRVSPRVTTSGEVDGVRITIEYGSPSKRGRVIWGGLRPWGQWWMPGADEATTMTASGALMIGTIAVPAGAHTIYTVPDPQTFLLTINTRTGQFHTQYSPNRDLGRTPMSLRMLAAPVEQLTFAVVPQAGGGGFLTLAWDDREYAVPVRATVPTVH